MSKTAAGDVQTADAKASRVTSETKNAQTPAAVEGNPSEKTISQTGIEVNAVQENQRGQRPGETLGRDREMKPEPMRQTGLRRQAKRQPILDPARRDLPPELRRALAAEEARMGEDRDIIRAAYHRGQDVHAYVLAMRDGINLLAAQGTNREALDRVNMTRVLTEDQRDAAWQVGHRKYEAWARENERTRTAAPIADSMPYRRLNEAYDRMSNASTLPSQKDRGNIPEIGPKEANKAEEYYNVWSKGINANDAIKTLADYYDIKYNDSPRFELLKTYANDVESGWISPLSGFANYENLFGRIQNEIIGTKTSNGIVLTSQSRHFMQRVIGTMRDPKIYKNDHRIIRRSGVEVEDIIDALKNGKALSIRSEGSRKSQTFITAKCKVSVNPDTGMLIQCSFNEE